LLVGVLLVCVAKSGLVVADAAPAIPTVGILWFADSSRAAQYLQPFKQDLRELGWIEGRTVRIIEKYDNGDPSRLPALAEQLVRGGANVLFVYAGAVPAAHQATQKLPIVCPDFYDPIAEGATHSMAHPTGNITGLSFQSVESAAKRLQLAREFNPGWRRVGHLFDPDDAGAKIEAEGLMRAAHDAGIDLKSIGVHTSKDLPAAYAKLKSERREVVLVTPSLATFNERDKVIALALENRIPVISEMPEFADAGALLTYGPDIIGTYRRGAYFVDKLLRGTKTSDLPIEQPTQFHLVVNLRTSRSLGLSVPDSIMERATRVIR